MYRKEFSRKRTIFSQLRRLSGRSSPKCSSGRKKRRRKTSYIGTFYESRPDVFYFLLPEPRYTLVLYIQEKHVFANINMMRNESRVACGFGPWCNSRRFCSQMTDLLGYANSNHGALRGLGKRTRPGRTLADNLVGYISLIHKSLYSSPDSPAAPGLLDRGFAARRYTTQVVLSTHSQGESKHARHSKPNLLCTLSYCIWGQHVQG